MPWLWGGGRKLYALSPALADTNKHFLYWVTSSCFRLKLILQGFLIKGISSCFLQLYSGIGGKARSVQ